MSFVCQTFFNFFLDGSGIWQVASVARDCGGHKEQGKRSRVSTHALIKLLVYEALSSQCMSP